MRIARIIARLNVGGPTRHVTWLTAALPDHEFETLLITGVVPPGEDDMSWFAHERGIAPVVIPEMSREISPRDIITVAKLVRLFRRFKPDIVHTHTAKAGAVGRVAGFLYRWLGWSTLRGRPRRITFVHTYHGHVFHSYYGRWKTALFLFIERTLAKVTDTIVVLSEQQRDEIQRVFRVGRAEQFRIVPLGVDTEELAAGLREGGTAAGPVVAIVGRLTAIKNHDLFLRVVTRLGDLPQAQFVVYGDGAERTSLEKRAHDLGLTDRVRFAGTRSTDEIYSSIDVSALTSLNEGTPLTLIEAMCAGVACISTAVGGVVDVLGAIQEEVREGAVSYAIRERGISVASEDEVSYAAALRRLILDVGLRKRLAEAGRAHARIRYSKERLIADLTALYREQLPGKRSRR